MEIEGVIKMVGETQTFGSNGFRKRELVITTQEQYPQHILVEFVQDKCDILNNYMVGQSVKVGINLRGREYVNPQGKTKFFNSIQGWKINLTEQQSQNESAVDNYEQQNAKGPTNSVMDDQDEDDLPF